MPVFIVLQIRVGRVRRRVAASTQASLSDMSAITQESLSVSGVLLAKVFGRQDHEIERYRAENARQTDLQVRQTMTGQSFFAVVQAFFAITPAAVYLVAGYVGTGSGAGLLSAGTLVAFTTLQSRLLFPTVQLLRVSLDVQTSLALFSRIFAYLDLVPALTDPPRPRVLDKAHAAGSVEFRDVWFHYPPSEDDEPGRDDTGASPRTDVGAAGAVAADRAGPARRRRRTERGGQDQPLLPRARASTTSTAARCASTGSTSASWPSSSLAQVLGMVTQDTYLFHATIAENLRYAAPDATDAELVAAARAANIHDRIVGLRPRATTPSWGSGATASPAGRSSVSRSPG